MDERDFEEHNEEVRRVWESYRARKPLRVPVFFGINPRFLLLNPQSDPQRLTFERYWTEPDAMFDFQLYFQDWVRHEVVQDAEMGVPREGWEISVDLQNSYEGGWFGCPIEFREGQVPDTRPILGDENKRLLFDLDMPDPFEGGLMKKAWEFYYRFREKAEGYEYRGAAVKVKPPPGWGTDGPFTAAVSLRGGTELCLDLAVDPDYVHELLDFITEATICRIKAFRRRLGLPELAEGFAFADDSIQLISTEMYREFVLPCHKRLAEALGGPGERSIHLCGDASRHFPTIREELGVTSFDTGFPIDFGQVRRQLGPDVEICGGPDVAFLLSATPERARQRVREILSSGVMEGGRFCLREGNNVAPLTPLENLRAVYEAGREFGRY